ncbi:hypothetical protein BaRGS_00019483 [Batillaria attramentaria]|uniref:Uncharacterized protein n=1 Tax=Batillaria attramentaria TaxID=370345 RepID=A0ABD0KQK4_9CAEN
MATGGDSRAKPETNKLKCGICLERYRRPKLLPCFHTFCQACLQTVAGTSPSFPCPACRTPVIVPPGGVGALQTNFYIEEDLDNDPSNTKLCYVCAEQREATYKCLQCRQKFCDTCRRVHDAFTVCRSHTIISLLTNQADEADLKGKAVVHSRDEKCLKHPKHDSILYCSACKTNICMQCKLTSHEGHPTEDLEDAGAKVKAKIQQMLKNAEQQKALLDGVLAAADHESKRLQELGRKMEEEIRNRKQVLDQWSTQAADQAVESVHATVEMNISCLQERTQQVRDQQAAVVAQQGHLTRVLDSDIDADIVSLEAQLSEVTVDRGKLLKLQEKLKEEAADIMCKHNPGAINLSDMMAFVGVLEKRASEETSTCVSTEHAEPAEPATAVATNTQHDLPRSKVAGTTPREFIYSRNPESRISAINPISQSRFWVRYTPSGTGVKMDLYNEMGELLESREDFLRRSMAGTVLSDISITDSNDWNKILWIQPGNKYGVIDAKNTDFRPACKSSGHANRGIVVRTYVNETAEGYDEVSFESLQPLKWNMLNRFGHFGSDVLLDASNNREYFAFRNDSVVNVYRKVISSTKPIHDSTYNPLGDMPTSDACFCQIDGREMLVVAVERNNAVHVVDHTDGCLFVRYLNTEPFTLDRPCCLATDYNHRLWIGCHGGKVILVYL